MKKVAKATTKLRLAKDAVAQLESKDDASLEELEKCPDLVTIEAELREVRERYESIRALNEKLDGIKKSNVAEFETFAKTAAALDIGDAPPPRPPRGSKKPKQPNQKTGPRVPYFTYVSLDGIEIRVGRKSEDNDALSCDLKHRDDSNWWMHAAGCPGSHVVIRHDGEIETLPADTVLDAAVLALENSKAIKGQKGSVSLVRCRQVSKPIGAKAGLVHLSGFVRSVLVTGKDVKERLVRLIETKK
jgi:predicted ribosome quality control (RQC) complex YloA/Tae2 family protein